MSSSSTTSLPVAISRTRRAVIGSLALLAAAAIAFSLISRGWLQVDRTQLHADIHDRVIVWGPTHTIEIGLRNMELCFDDRCFVIANSDLPGEWIRTLLVRAHTPWEIGGRTPVDVISEDIYNATRIDPDKARQLAGEMTRGSPGFAALGMTVLIASGIAIVCLVITALLVFLGIRISLPVMPTTLAVLSLAVALICGCVFIAIGPGPGGYVGIGEGFIVLGVGVAIGVWSAIKLSGMLRPIDYWH